MNHPDSAEWMSHLYDELPASRRAELDVHLAQCPECRRQWSEWRRAASELAAWKPVDARRALTAPIPKLRWGLAALFFVMAAFAAGRLTSPAPDLAGLRAQLEPQLRVKVLGDLNAKLEGERREWVALLADVESQRASEYTALRKDLETVALVADARIERTRDDLGQIAALTQVNLTPER